MLRMLEGLLTTGHRFKQVSDIGSEYGLISSYVKNVSVSISYNTSHF